MKKLIIVSLFLFLSSMLYAVSARPGSGLTYDGSVRREMEYADSGSGMLRASALEKASVSTTGNKKILVILTRFLDYGFDESASRHGRAPDATHDVSYYKKLLETGSGITMTKYYKQQSHNALNLSFQILGLEGDTYKSSKTWTYYGQNDIYNNDLHPAELVYEMLSEVSTSGDADADVDNCTVIIVHAGPGEEEGGIGSNYIWSHRDTLYKNGFSPVTINGKSFNDYIIVPEYYFWGGIAEATVGVYCHEFGHVLGLQDAYDTSYATAGVGQWSLMGGGEWGTMGKEGVAPGADPTPYMGWELAKLGWISEENITPASGESASYSFTEMNSSSKVYRVDLSSDQYLTLEGKAKNLDGTDMAVYETGLLITQVHTGILNKYGTANRINSGNYRPHGSMVVEAKASNYKTNGLGDLWRGSSNVYRVTTQALFRSDTLTTVRPVVSSSSTDYAFIPLIISTIIGSGFVISILVSWYAGRRKLCALFAVTALAALISAGCSISSGGGSTYDSGPNTNYYTSMSNVHSKTGISGITIYDIKVNSDGSGSFSVKKD